MCYNKTIENSTDRSEAKMVRLISKKYRQCFFFSQMSVLYRWYESCGFSGNSLLTEHCRFPLNGICRRIWFRKVRESNGNDGVCPGYWRRLVQRFYSVFCVTFSHSMPPVMCLRTPWRTGNAGAFPIWKPAQKAAARRSCETVYRRTAAIQQKVFNITANGAVAGGNRMNAWVMYCGWLSAEWMVSASMTEREGIHPLCGRFQCTSDCGYAGDQRGVWRSCD